MPNKKILYVTTELAPYQEDSVMGQRVHSMALKMYAESNDVRVFMPRFGVISERKFQLHEVIRLSGMNIIINDLDQPLLIKVASLPNERLQVYFIDNEEYFKRKYYYSGEDGANFNDNDERAIFFARGVLETIKKLNWVPDVIHLNGWMTSLIPIYLKTFYKNDEYFQNTKIILSIYPEKEILLGSDSASKFGFDKVDIPIAGKKLTSTDLQIAALPLVHQVVRMEKTPAALLKKLAVSNIEILEQKSIEDLEELYN